MLPSHIEQKIQFTETCWLWLGATTNGYGRVLSGGVNKYAHKVIYELLVGFVPDGLDLDHLCRIRICVNPRHLEPVSRAENVHRGARGILKTHCKRGHEFNEENTRFYQNRRVCRQCDVKRGSGWARARMSRDMTHAN